MTTRAITGVCAVVMTLAAAGAAAAAAPPGRVVSLNPCIDGILMQVADPRQIAALSAYSRDPAQSAVAAEARAYPFTGGSGEEIVALRPDLVLGSGAVAAQLDHILPRLHIRHETFTVPSTIEESLTQVTRVAALVGRPERGAVLNARIRAALVAAAPAPGEKRFQALIFEGHGIASGPRTLMSALMDAAGFDNIAGSYGLRGTLDIPLEVLIARPPQVLLSGRLAPGEPSWADRVLSHPALKTLERRILRETFPEPLMFCGGPVIIPAIEALALARKRAQRGVSQ